jgi:hypothetical protein
VTSWLGDYRPGRPYAICDRCGFTYRLDELRTEWTNLKVCDGCYDARPAHLDTPLLKPGEGAPIPGARPDIVYQTSQVLWTDSTDMLWSDGTPVYWTDDEIV